MSTSCASKYPILLLHGAGFRDLRLPVYWGRIPGELIRRGAVVRHGEQDCWASTEENAVFLKRRVLELLAETKSEKLNIIGHSKGGLEARMLASGLGMAERIASVITVATPHRGSKTVDALLRAPELFFKLAALGVNSWIRLIGDRRPDFIAVCRGFSTGAMAEFNRENPDAPGVYYRSFACAMSGPLSDFNLAAANAIINSIEGENDGLVSVESALWGENRTILRSPVRRGVSHLDAIDFRRAPFCGKRDGGVCDIIDLYVDIAKDLKARGL